MRSLVSYLNERTPQELRWIAERWEASLSDRLYTGNTFPLSQEITNSFLQRRLLEKLELTDLKMLCLFLNEPDFSSEMPQIAEKTGLDNSKVAVMVGKLRQIGLIYDDKVRLENAEEAVAIAEPPRKGWAEYSRRPANTGTPTVPKKPILRIPRELARPLKRILTEYLVSKGELEPPMLSLKLSQLPLAQLLLKVEPEIIELESDSWGIYNLAGSSPEKLAEEMVTALTDQHMQEKVLGNLPHDSKELFTKLKQKRTTIPALLEEYVSLRRLGRTIRPLIDKLLVWESFEEGQSVVFVPSEIAQPRAVTPQHTRPLQTMVEPTHVTKFPPYALAWDALTFLNYLGQNEVELTQQDYIPKRHMKKLATKLWKSHNQDEMARVGFLVDLCQDLKLYRCEPYNTLLTLGFELNDWLSFDIYEQTRQFFNYWLNHPRNVYPVTFPYPYSDNESIEKANRAILGWLADCEPEVWYTAASLTARVRNEDPYFIRPRRELLNRLGAAKLEYFERIWDKIEGEIIRATLGSALEWLGLVRVERNDEGEVLSFCLNSFGAELVKQAAPPSVLSAKNTLLVQPNFEVMLFVPDVKVLWKLLKFTDIKKLDTVCIFVITRESVLRGLESGLTSSVMQEWLTEHSRQPLPQNLEASIQDWSKGFRRVMLERVTLLEVDDPQVLTELLKMKQYSDYFVRRLSPTAAVIRLPEVGAHSQVDPLKTLRNLLKNEGFFAR